MNVVASRVDEHSIRRVLDLGCGTGRFSESLAVRFDANVVGIDPSRKMLEQARRRPEQVHVSYACGCAEALPLRENSVDLIFISMVFHHFTDSHKAVQECGRVLRDQGRVCLRTASREKILMYPYVSFFPASRGILEQRVPSLGAQCEIFESNSFRILSSDVVTQEIARDYSSYADRLSARADSILISISDAEFEAGLKALRCEKSEGPIVEPIDFVVFEKCM
jgi:ubiquinone/menaquinone biosynthesis C-methylase UbiE